MTNLEKKTYCENRSDELIKEIQDYANQFDSFDDCCEHEFFKTKNYEAYLFMKEARTIQV